MAVMSMKRFRPLGNFVLVNPHKTESASPIIAPPGAKPVNAFIRATIVSKGSNVQEVNNRDVVLLPESVGQPIIIDNFQYKLVRIQDIIAII
jgi:co-chaperonin GroES (HSP10)